MQDEFARQVVAECDDDEIRDILQEVCALTHMGFVAVARVTDERWIACQVVDRIGFGLDPGEELDLKTTICDEIRECGSPIIIDEVGASPEWRQHPVPALYGFQSYASLPICLADGTFYGTLCAIDPEPRHLSAADTIGRLKEYADRVASILSAKVGVTDASSATG